jgi:hypothetical protein
MSGQEIIEQVRAGYAFDGPAVELGALVTSEGGKPGTVPDVKVRIPLSVFNRHGLVAGATGPPRPAGRSCGASSAPPAVDARHAALTSRYRCGRSSHSSGYGRSSP